MYTRNVYFRIKFIWISLPLSDTEQTIPYAATKHKIQILLSTQTVRALLTQWSLLTKFHKPYRLEWKKKFLFVIDAYEKFYKTNYFIAYTRNRFKTVTNTFRSFF